MNPIQTELLARELTERRLRASAHPFPPVDRQPLPPRRRPLGWVGDGVAAVVRRARAGGRPTPHSFPGAS